MSRTRVLSLLLLSLSSACGGREVPIPVAPRDAGPDLFVCADVDGDGYGVGCAAGPDCDDTNAAQTGVEVCDGVDNDCDATVDEGVLSACGDCDSNCRPVGFPGAEGFDLASEPSEGLVVDDTGALALERQTFVSNHLIWIANTGQGTVSKVDTRTFEELARYYTGPAGLLNDPSRTSVGLGGDVYIGNRGQMSVTKISSLGDACPDTNGDGRITTSHGTTELLPWGDDDCVLWNTPLLGGLTRAIAAHVERGPDGELVEYVWAGTYDTSEMSKLDGTTGALLFRVPAPAQPYGFAFDGRQNLWIASLGNVLGRVDTTRCVDAASCVVTPCREAGGDDCVLQSIDIPDGMYGITVDARQRVWLGGGTSPKRYDPLAPPGTRLRTTLTSIFVHGIAADGIGNIWGAGMDQGLVRIDAEDPSRFAIVPATVGSSPKGVAVDDDGKVWAINQANDDATVVVPGAAIDEFTVWTAVVPVLVQPYTYSDMTGQQLRIATSLTGYYRHVVDACPGAPEGPTSWRTMTFDADVPDGTSLTIRVRTADTRAALMAQPWVRIAEVPGDVSPVEVGAALTAAGVTPGALLEVSVELGSWRSRGASYSTPRFRGFQVEVSKQCVIIG